MASASVRVFSGGLRETRVPCGAFGGVRFFFVLRTGVRAGPRWRCPGVWLPVEEVVIFRGLSRP
eukprot:9182363-Lingulodinium_polyedra.AAC.1